MKSLVKTGLCMIAAIMATVSARADEITDVRFGVHDDFTRVVIESSEPIAFNAFTLSDPAARLVVSLPGAGWAVQGLENGRGEGHGLVGDFRFDPSGSTPRLILELTETAVVREQFALDPGEGGHRLVVDIARSDEARFTQASGFPSGSQTLTQLVVERAQVSYMPPSCENIRIVVDPGHGGRDPGALSRFGGAHEKTIALNAGLKLRDLLESTGRFEVVMTRETDVFLELNERIEIAQSADADLFISLHVDSVASESASAKGPTVYTLSDSGASRARNRAITEGDWFLAGNSRPDEVNSLLLDMSLREKRNQSLLFGDLLLSNISQVAAPLRPVPQERGFYVLLDSQVPAILFEMGFQTNPEDSRNLNDDAYVERLMNAAAESISGYFARCGDSGQGARVAASLMSDAASR